MKFLEDDTAYFYLIYATGPQSWFLPVCLV